MQDQQLRITALSAQSVRVDALSRSQFFGDGLHDREETHDLDKNHLRR